MLKVAIDKQIAAWLAKRLPDRYSKHLIINKRVNGIRFYFVMRLGFDLDHKRQVAKEWEGLQPAQIIYLKDYSEDQA